MSKRTPDRKIPDVTRDRLRSAKVDRTTESQAAQLEAILANAGSRQELLDGLAASYRGGDVSATDLAGFDRALGGLDSLDAPSGTKLAEGPGEPISRAVQGPLEAIFGRSLSSIRVHSDLEGATIASGLGARAAASGRDIFVSTPALATDLALMGHEVSHVVAGTQAVALAEDQGTTIASTQMDEKKKKEEAEKKKQDTAEFEKQLKAMYEDQFGKKAGDQIYSLIKSTLGSDKLIDYGKKGVEAGFKALEGLDQEGADAISQKLGMSWDDICKKLAGELMADEKTRDMLDKLSKFTRSHPWWVLSIALLGAIGAAILVYQKNMDLPAIKQMFKVNDQLKLGFKLDIGKIQELSLQSLHGYIDYHTKKFSFKADIGWDKIEDKETGTREVFTIKGDASHTIMDKTTQEIDEASGVVKQEYATKLTQTFGTVFEYDAKKWTLESMQLAYGIALDARDKKLVDYRKKDQLETAVYKEQVFSMYAKYLQKFQNYQGQMQTADLNLSVGLSWVMNTQVETSTIGPDGKPAKIKLTPQSYGFSWSLDYKNSALNPTMNPKGTTEIGTNLGFFYKKDNWEFNAGVSYMQDINKNKGNFGATVGFTFRFP